jgi:hypothetical protein
MTPEALNIMIGNLPLSFVMLFFYYKLNVRVAVNETNIKNLEKGFKK